MADTSMRIPRRKNGAKFHPKEAPFPVPIESITGKESCSDRWYYYTGYFRDSAVVIEDLGDLTFLYKMGFFGKGFLSRSKPAYEVISNISQKAFSKSEKLRRLPPREREIRQSKFRVIRKERYKNHKQWWEQVCGERLTGCGVVKEENSEEELRDNSANIPDEEDQNVCPKRRKVDNDLSNDEPSAIQPDSCGEDIRVHSTDDEDTGDCKSEDETETCVTNRDLQEVIQDVARKSNEHKPEVTKEAKQLKQKTNNLKKDDPYKVYEHLQLNLEEAFFLSYGLGCLSVFNNNKKPLSLSEMWCSFCAAKEDFIPSYITYHYFRSKGWVPKVGIKFGTDWVLYKEGMPFYHSSYSVIVQMVESESLDQRDSSISCRQLTWPQLCGVSRVSGDAAKEVMLCYVIKPSDMTTDELSSPKCIKRFKLQEVVLRRWIPERAREPEKEKK